MRRVPGPYGVNVEAEAACNARGAGGTVGRRPDHGAGGAALGVSEAVSESRFGVEWCRGCADGGSAGTQRDGCPLLPGSHGSRVSAHALAAKGKRDLGGIEGLLYPTAIVFIYL